LGRDAESDFGLNDNVYFVDEIREGEEVMKDRRSDVVGKIAVDADAASGSNGGEVRLQNVAWYDIEIGKFFREVAKAGDERRVDFDGVHRRAGGEEVLGHFAVTGADFDPAVLIVLQERNGGMARNADGTRDLFAPVEIGEEVLAEALASHGWNSVAGGAGEAARGKEVRR